MKNCTFCTKTGFDRSYTVDEELLCDKHYIAILETLLIEKVDEVTKDDVKSAFEKYKIKLEPKVAPIKSSARLTPTPYRKNPFKMGM